MNQTSDPATTSPTLSSTARVFWTVLILATLYLCYFHNLGAIGLVGPDEPRYAWIARDMAETGDWVTPRLYGKPWFEKPPLYYWGAALSFKIFGVSEVTARLPSAICALLATLAITWLAWRLYGAETSRWLLLLLPTTVGMVGFSHAAATDMPFAAMLTITMVLAAGVLGLVPSAGFSVHTPVSNYSNTRPAGVLALFLFGVFLGLATLAKGPAAIILSGGAVLLWAVFTKRWRDAFRCFHPVAIASFCLTALPWYILCARRNPDFFRVFIIEHNFKRFLTPEFQHIQPFWFYIPILLIAFLPWTFLLVLAGWYGAIKFWRERKMSPATTLFFCWGFFGVFFFSISKSKLPGYILPAIPVIGILLARTLIHLTLVSAKYFRWLLALYGWLLAITGLLLFLSLGHVQVSPLTRASRDVSLILLMFAFANWVIMFHKTRFESRIPASACCVLPILLLLGYVPRLLPGFLPHDPSGDTLAAETLSSHLVSDLYVGPISRGQYFSLNFYLHSETKEWDKTNPQEGYLLLRFKGCHFEVGPGWTCSASPIELPKSGWFIYRVERDTSLGGLGGGSAGNSLKDGQARQEK